MSTLGSDAAVTLVIRSTRLTATGPRFGGIVIAGLGYLRDRGLAEAMLYVDEDNVPAIRMYSGLGFTRWSTDAMYRQRIT